MYISDDILNKSVGSKVLYTRVTIMTFDFITTDEITGVVIGNPSYTNDSTSDIRRTMNIMLYPTNSTFDVSRGGIIWMDKYVRVEIGVKMDYDDDITYFNMGTYVIDNPSKAYSATENSLTLNCVDIMSRLTGNRGGIIEGITHVIPQNSNVREAIIAILKEGRINRYVVDECEIDVPYDITVDGGSSLYDLLKELVNLLPNYQIYFDVDGVFHYDLIPNGENEPIMVDDKIWQDILIDYETSYNFEGVKNCIEVIGGAHDNSLYLFTINYQRDAREDITEGQQLSDAVTIVEQVNDDDPYTRDQFIELLNGVCQSYVDNPSSYKAGYICIEFPPFYEFVGKISLSTIKVWNADWTTFIYLNMPEPIVFDLLPNESVYLYLKLSTISSYSTYNRVDNKRGWYLCTYAPDYLGEYQPRAVLYETNPNSPFFDSINYHCTATFNPNEIDNVGSSSTQLTQYSVLRLFIDASWQGLGESLQTMVFQYSLGANSNAPMDISSLHKDSNNMCRVHYYFKDGAKYVEQTTYRGYIRADLLTQGTHIARYHYQGEYNQKLMPYQPSSLGVLRQVCSGDEYDNIWSDNLAMQRAKFELYQRCRLLDTVTINVVPQYWLDTNWLVEITLPNKNGIEEKNQYLIKSITTDGGVDGSQSLTLMRYYPYYPSI